MASEFMTGFQNAFAALRWDEESLANGRPTRLLRNALSCGGKDFIDELSEMVLSNERLQDQAEENPTLTRVVLYECPRSGSKLRFHSFEVGSDARPHNHRWPFASCIITGGYDHTIYEKVIVQGTHVLKPLMSHAAKQGDAYVLSSDCFHRTHVTMATASLVLQGPPDTATWERHAASTVETFTSRSTLNTVKRKLPRMRLGGLLSDLQNAFAQLQMSGLLDDGI